MQVNTCEPLTMARQSATRHLGVLETGHVLPRAPWEMHADLRAAPRAR
jgi:hypothetical protein